MAFRVFAVFCVAMALQAAGAEEAQLEPIVTCLNGWWSTNKDVLLEDPKHLPLKDIMETALSTTWLSDPFAQMAMDSGIGNIQQDARTANIGTDGFKCIECIRQLAPRPAHCGQQSEEDSSGED